jgi:hypothetical protein
VREPIGFVPGRLREPPDPRVWIQYQGPGGPLDISFDGDHARTIVAGRGSFHLELDWGQLSTVDDEEERRLRDGVRGRVGEAEISVHQPDAFWREVSITVATRSWLVRRRLRRVVERDDGTRLAEFRGDAGGWVLSDASVLEGAITALAWALFLPLVGPRMPSMSAVPDGPDWGMPDGD